jgi:opacity protein-like surface antigen
MHLSSIQRQVFKLVLAALLAATASSMFAQVAPAVRNGGTSKLALGGGVSYFDVDWGKTRKEGYTLWADWHPPLLPSFLNGLNLEIEGRDIRWNAGDKPPGFRQVTGSGGVMYEWRHFRNFRPYGKGNFGFGSIYFGKDQGGVPSKPYTHDTRTVYAPGGGLEYRVVGDLWARADYEYQFWPELLGKNKVLNPQGFTFGAVYNIRTGSHR